MPPHSFKASDGEDEDLMTVLMQLKVSGLRHMLTQTRQSYTNDLSKKELAGMLMQLLITGMDWSESTRTVATSSKTAAVSTKTAAASSKTATSSKRATPVKKTAVTAKPDAMMAAKPEAVMMEMIDTLNDKIYSGQQDAKHIFRQLDAITSRVQSLEDKHAVLDSMVQTAKLAKKAEEAEEVDDEEGEEAEEGDAAEEGGEEEAEEAEEEDEEEAEEAEEEDEEEAEEAEEDEEEVPKSKVAKKANKDDTDLGPDFKVRVRML